MLGLKNKQQLAEEAHKLAASFNLVRYRDITYLPVDYETKLADPPPDSERTIWLPLGPHHVRRMASATFSTLFANDSELRSFNFMVAQHALHVDMHATALLIRTPDGLMRLGEDGRLTEPDGKFLPNTIIPMLNTDQKMKDEVFGVITEWVDSEEEAHSLLSHLATCLSPGYSTVKYVLLLGEGRNGKSLLLKMLLELFGRENVSTVTRQQMSEQSPTVAELNGKLMNMVFDGRAEYLKDSGTEKSLIAGETVPIRLLYESVPTLVRTNALFIEGLNREPKSSDKSSALQKRLVRFAFPNVYALNHKFERRMLAEERLGAFLSLLIDHYVKEEAVAELLAPTQKAIELQLDHMYVNSLALQFFKYLEESGTFGVNGLLNQPINDIVPLFQSWRLKENDLGSWAEPDVLALFTPLLNTERRSQRTPAGPRKVRVVTSLNTEARAFIDSLEGDEDGGDSVGADLSAMVED